MTINVDIRFPNKNNDISIAKIDIIKFLFFITRNNLLKKNNVIRIGITVIKKNFIL